jgi:cellulose synthase/poly-beta-1,6-N-acetylglucosamine synthase-like glycosyltransferase
MMADESRENKQPMVSVHMLTYNHAPYIAQAIDSVLIQEVGFDYELVIGDDCSTDETREIVRAYRDQHPDIIRLYQHERNIGLYACWKTIRSTPAAFTGHAGLNRVARHTILARPTPNPFSLWMIY